MRISIMISNRGVFYAYLDHLWRQVIERATQGRALGAGGVHRPPKVRDLQLALRTRTHRQGALNIDNSDTEGIPDT